MNQKVMKLRLSLVVVLILVATAGFTSCEKIGIKPVPFDPTTVWHFNADVQPIFNANCITCHNGSKSPDLREGKSFSALSKGYITLPAESSRIYVKISSDSQHIPRTSDTQKLIILNWLKQGANNN